jgi:hypothetical protein
MEPDLSVPVIWVEDGGAPSAGRLDLHADRLHLDGGPAADRRLRDVAYAEIESVRVGRANRDRIKGRQAIVLALAGGATLSFAGFGRPGTLLEIAQRLTLAL